MSPILNSTLCNASQGLLRCELVLFMFVNGRPGRYRALFTRLKVWCITLMLQARENWSRRWDSNPRVLTEPDYKSGAIDHYATSAKLVEMVRIELTCTTFSLYTSTTICQLFVIGQTRHLSCTTLNTFRLFRLLSMIRHCNYPMSSHSFLYRSLFMSCGYAARASVFSSFVFFHLGMNTMVAYKEDLRNVETITSP